MTRTVVFVSLLLLACSPEKPPSDWTLESASCSVVSNALIGGQSAQWTGCRVHYYAAGDVYTVQLMRAGTTGSFALPGPGWLTLNLDGDAPEYTTLPVRASGGEPLPVSVPPDSISVVYETLSNQMVYGSGELQVGQDLVSASGKTLSFDADLWGLTLGSAAATGTITVQAAEGINASAPPSGPL